MQFIVAFWLKINPVNYHFIMQKMLALKIW